MKFWNFCQMLNLIEIILLFIYMVNYFFILFCKRFVLFIVPFCNDIARVADMALNLNLLLLLLMCVLVGSNTYLLFQLICLLIIHFSHTKSTSPRPRARYPPSSKPGKELSSVT